jgi:hypothetical protein
VSDSGTRQVWAGARNVNGAGAAPAAAGAGRRV